MLVEYCSVESNPAVIGLVGSRAVVLPFKLKIRRYIFFDKLNGKNMFI